MSLDVVDHPPGAQPDVAPVRRTVETPLQSAARTSTGPANYKVAKLVDGSQHYLGQVGSRATPETIIARFPLTLPVPGQTADYLFQGLTALGEETGRPFQITLTGDSPDVVAARARVVPGTGTPGAAVAETEVARLLRLQEERIERMLKEERDLLKRKEDALALEARTLADKAAKQAEAQASAQQSFFQNQLLLQKQQHDQAMEAERERRRQDRDDAEARRKADKEEREAREKADALARRERQDREDQARKDEAQRQREHQERMAAMSASTTLDTLIPKLVAGAAALGIKPQDVAARLLAPPAGDGSMSTAEIAGMVMGGVGKLSDNVTEVVKLNMELAARRDGVQLPQKQVVQKLMLPPPPKEEKREEKEPEKAQGGSQRNAAIEALPKPLVRDARVALRELAATLRAKPEAEREAALVAFMVAKGAKVKPYTQAMGIKAAALEAGATEAEATELERRINAFGVG